MYIFGYLRASTLEQDASRAKQRFHDFVSTRGYRIAAWYEENASGASLQRPALMRLLDDAAPGDAILVEQIDRLSRMDDAGWSTLKYFIHEKNLRVISLDLPTSQIALSTQAADDFTSSMLSAINNMMLDMLAAIAHKDYQDRRRRQNEGIAKAKQLGRYQGRKPNLALHDKIIKLHVDNKLSIKETADLTGVSTRTVIRVCQSKKNA